MENNDESSATAVVANPTGKQIIIDRTFEAPMALVFNMWTNPEYLARWWGPKNNTNSVCRMDVRPGGAISITMHPGDGQMIEVNGVFDEVRIPDKLVFTTVKNDAYSEAQLKVLHTINLSENNGITRLIMYVEVVRTSAVFNTSCQHMEQGWEQSFDRLGEELLRMVN
jgi:uncharacterized protein YndB with AHSA1/START domain